MISGVGGGGVEAVLILEFQYSFAPNLPFQK